MMEVVLLWR